MQSIGIWGAIFLTRAANAAGHRRRRGMGRLGAALHGMGARHGRRGLVAAWPQFGVPCRPVPGEPRDPGVVSAWSGADYAAGLARPIHSFSIVLIGVGLWHIRLGILETPVFQQLVATRPDRTRTDPGGDQDASPGRSSSPPCCACPSRRRCSTFSPRSCFPTASARCSCRGNLILSGGARRASCCVHRTIPAVWPHLPIGSGAGKCT